MRGRLGYPSDTCPLNNRSFAFNSTGRRGVLCDGRRSEKKIFSTKDTVKFLHDIDDY